MAANAHFTVPYLNPGQKHYTFPAFTTWHDGQQFTWEVSLHQKGPRSASGYYGDPRYGWDMVLKCPKDVVIEITQGSVFDGGVVLEFLHGIRFVTGRKVRLHLGSVKCDDTIGFHIQDVRYLLNPESQKPDKAKTSLKKSSLELLGAKLLEKVLRGEPDPDSDGNFRLVSADGDTFYGHKAILIGMEYFERNFGSKTKDVTEGKIEFNDIRSSTLRKILSLAYTGEYEQVKEYDFEEIKGLFHAFDKFMLTEESKKLQKVVKKFLSPKNVGEILVMSDLYKLEDLKAEALKVAKRNVKHLFGPIWKEIYAKEDLMKELLEDFAK